jgi:hypothetical protein
MSALICSVTRFSCSRARATGATTSVNSLTGAEMPGMRTGASESSRYLDHHHGVLALLERLVEEQLGVRGMVSSSK